MLVQVTARGLNDQPRYDADEDPREPPREPPFLSRLPRHQPQRDQQQHADQPHTDRHEVIVIIHGHPVGNDGEKQQPDGRRRLYQQPRTRRGHRPRRFARIHQIRPAPDRDEAEARDAHADKTHESRGMSTDPERERHEREADDGGFLDPDGGGPTQDHAPPSVAPRRQPTGPHHGQRGQEFRPTRRIRHRFHVQRMEYPEGRHQRRETRGQPDPLRQPPEHARREEMQREIQPVRRDGPLDHRPTPGGQRAPRPDRRDGCVPPRLILIDKRRAPDGAVGPDRQPDQREDRGLHRVRASSRPSAARLSRAVCFVASRSHAGTSGPSAKTSAR